MDLVKEAFYKVRQDMDMLREELTFLRKGLTETRTQMIEMCNILNKLNKKTEEFNQKQTNIDTTHKPPIPATSTYTSTHNTSFNLLKPPISSISIGNEGVSTDRQTDRQTDKSTTNTVEKGQDSIDNAAEILNSLDNIKKEVRIKFKRITEQELLVFSTIYQLDEEQGHADYKVLSERLKLTESSIRDYVQRLIKKGIPVEKKRINNKTILLSVSQNLKKIASLSTILQLREL